jgi:hypothetical protein
VPRRIRLLFLGFALAVAAVPAHADRTDRRAGDQSTDGEVGASLGEALTDAVSLHYVSDPLPRAVDPTGSRGHAEVVVSLPIAGPLSVEGGMRMRYQQVRDVNEVELLPTAGFEIRF